MAPGLDSTKEELQATAEYFLARGLATLAIDGPGQGESEYELPIEPAYEKVATAAVDYLQDRAGLDRERIGLFGVSLGGYYAARSAAPTRSACGRSSRSRARTASTWTGTSFPRRPGPPSRPARARSPSEEARAKAAALTLEEAAAHIEAPLLVVGGGRDAIVPAYHQERLAKEVKTAELVLYPDGSHGVTNRAYESRSRMADWLAARLHS